MTYRSTKARLFAAAREAYTDDTTAPVDYDISEGDLLHAEDENLATAVEALLDKADSLQRLSDKLETIPTSKATPELIETVQTTLTSPDLPAIATEADDPNAWDKTKSHASAAGKAVAEAVKRGAKQLMEFLDTILSWIITTRKGTRQKLAQAKANLSKAPQAASVPLTRKLKPLAMNQNFSPESAISCMKRYAEVLAASTYAVQDVFSVFDSVVGIMRPNFKPKAIGKMGDWFKERTKDALTWENNSAVVYNGEGGMHVRVTIAPKDRLEVDTSASGNAASDAIEAPASLTSDFTRNDIAGIIKYGDILLTGVEKLEPAIKKTQNSIRAFAAADVYMQGTTWKGVQAPTKESGLFFFMRMRGYLNFASKYGAGVALHAAHAAGNLVTAYMNQSNTADNEAADNFDDSKIVRPALPA